MPYLHNQNGRIIYIRKCSRSTGRTRRVLARMETLHIVHAEPVDTHAEIVSVPAPRPASDWCSAFSGSTGMACLPDRRTERPGP